MSGTFSPKAHRQTDGRTWWLYYDKWWINWMQLVGRPDALTRRERQPRIYWPMNFISFHLISFQLAVVGLCCPSLSTRCSRSGHSVTVSLYWDHGTNLTSISLVRRLAESSSASERFMWCLWKCGSRWRAWTLCHDSMRQRNELEEEQSSCFPRLESGWFILLRTPPKTIYTNKTGHTILWFKLTFDQLLLNNEM